MGKTLKKVLSAALVVLMLLSSVPLQELTGIDLPGLSTKAQAYGVPGYNAIAAAQWAKDHVYDTWSCLYGQCYWEPGTGDCANFVSQCIYMGGLDQTDGWNHTGYKAHFSTSSDGSWIRATQLHNYVVSIGGEDIKNPSVWQMEVGDLMFYKSSTSSIGFAHCAIVVDVNGGTATVAAHSTNYDRYLKTNWHLGFSNECTYLVKMHGATCTANKIRDFDIYVAGSSGSAKVYSEPSTSSKKLCSIISGDYAHIYQTRNVNGTIWGYTCNYRDGVKYGWVKLNELVYRGHASTGPVNHIMGDWYVKVQPTCTTVGVEERVCSRCGYKEQRNMSIGGKHKNVVAATCLDPSYCTACGKTISPALGHDWGDWKYTIEPTCLEGGHEKRVCQRCGLVEERDCDALGHDYQVSVTGPNCLDDGVNTYTCSRCKHKVIQYADENSKWSDWTTDVLELSSDKVKSKTQYRYSTKSTKTSSSNSLSGWTLYNTTYVWSDYGNWSSWSDSYVESSDSRKVETRNITQYHYYHYSLDKGNGGQDRSTVPIDMNEYNGLIDKGWLSARYATSEEAHGITLDYELTQDGTWHVGNIIVDAYIGYEDNCRYDNGSHLRDNWFRNSNYTTNKTQYRYADRSKNYGDWYTETPATCLTDGLEKRVCKNNASHVETNVLKALGHDYGDWVDDENGETHTKTCKRDGCNDTVEEHKVSVKHTMTEVERREAICLVDGYIKYECTKCDYTYNETLKAPGHDYGDWVDDENGETHTKTCKRDGCNDTVEDHKVSVKHTMTEVERREATCLVDGYIKYECTKCDYIYNETLKAPGHDYGDWVDDENGKTHTKTCKRDGCNDTVEEHKVSVKHNMKEVEKKEASYTEKGYIKYKCTDCSYTYTTDLEKIISYTATFIAPDKDGDYVYDGNNYRVVGTVVFPKGATAIVAPDVPQISGYIGYWEDYTLSDKDIVVKAVYELKSDGNESDLKTDKKVVYEDGIASITLSAFAETLNAKVPMGAKPYNIILVLDQSSSMTSNKIGSKTRLQVLKDVATDFVETVYDNAVENDVDHSIAIVGFAGSGNSYKGTGMYTPTGSLVNFNKLTSKSYASAYVGVRENAALLKSAISNLSTTQGTSADLGMEMARNILANDTGDRETIVVFITDGEPTLTGRFDSSIANDAIDYSNQIKNTYGATVYSIGVAAGANPTDETSNINKFLHAISSNYPKAKSMTNLGTAGMKSYFLTADDYDTLSGIFDAIFSQQIANTISFTKVNFYDTISEYFTLTAENEMALRESAKAQYGISDDDIIITRNADGTTLIRINNLIPKPVFDSNNVQTGWGASVNFDVTANDKTLDGGKFVTNTDEAGVESGNETVIKFKVPEGVEISSGRAIVEFRVDGEVYAIRQVNIGDTVTAPETDYAKWVITNGETVRSNYTVYNAKYTTEEKSITWHIGETDITETYHIGEIISAPEVNAPENTIFSGWNNTVPYRMPSSDLEFTAMFTSHEHSYTKSGISGDCLGGVITTYKCVCGDAYQETKTYDAHTYVANVKLENEQSIATMTCTVCGASESKIVKYQAIYTADRYTSSNYGGGKNNGWGGMNSSDKITNVIDINLASGDVNVQPDGYIYVKLYVEDAVLNKAKSGSLIVKRINEDSEDNIPYISGASTQSCGYYVDGSYLVLKLDHFSYYLLTSAEFESTAPTYRQIECAYKGHKYGKTITAPTCTAKGYTTYTCSVCGDTYTADETAKLGHDMSAYTTIKAPTCTEKGTEKAVCSRCDYYETKDISATGHNYENGTCTNCGATKSDNCSCNCHKTGFMGFIWKIQRFFYKIFGSHKVCSCGVKHY